MQFDSNEASGLIGTIAGVVSSILTTGIGFGIIKAKVERLEKDMDRAMENFVSLDLFNATVEPFRKDIHEIQRDIKKILAAVSGHNKIDD